MKSIIFCADGTWNGADVDDDHDGVPDSTNVLKLFHLLEGETTIGSPRLKDESEKILLAEGRPVQIAKYLHGVGDSSNPLMKLLGGAFGAGLIARIVRGYTFISRNYEPGDRIFLVGFSRGAYTARALGGMISSVGLLSREKLMFEKDKELAYALGVAAWRQYRDKAREQQQDRTLKQKLADLISSLPGYARIPLRDGDLMTAPVWAVAVWDTVGALGIPPIGGGGAGADAYRFTDDVLSGNVSHGIHAVSYDELRQSFAPTLWRTRESVKQYSFAGAHADVGGGYPAHESDLSNIALKWMLDELTSIGLEFRAFPSDWGMRPDAPFHEPWNEPLFRLLPKGQRGWTGYDLVQHQSLRARLAPKEDAKECAAG